jgi:hypothetical protein
MYTFALMFMQGVLSHMEQFNSDALTATNNSTNTTGSNLQAAVTAQLLQRHYSSLPRTMLSLLGAISGGDGWVAIADPIIALGPVYTACFFFYFCLGLYVLLNVMTGAFVSVALQSAELNREIAMDSDLVREGRIYSQMFDLFLDADWDGDGVMSSSDFSAFCHDERVRAFLLSLGLQPENVEKSFHLLSNTSASEHVHVNDFVNGCLKLRGGAKKIDVALLQEQNLICLRCCGSLQTWPPITWKSSYQRRRMSRRRIDRGLTEGFLSRDLAFCGKADSLLAQKGPPVCAVFGLCI